MQKNTASPHAIYAKVVNATDGAPITTGVVAFHVQGTTRAAVGGDVAAHIANGLWTYTPTQPETNYATFAIEFYHADAVGDGPLVQVVTDTAKALLDHMAPFCGQGKLTQARTGTEKVVCTAAQLNPDPVAAGLTAEYTVDDEGNREPTFT